ncbi:MAG: hypothetical protein CMM59_06630 [Rhodospirillaceae bacterium]|nr:hypothetical protein [Rhodospirillaceae bacterium]|tara:strand:+ start:185 stop:616 length:432 start_codon:yes stop_codon:yes gene_type:complete
MKIELLKNAFRGVTRQEEAALAALAIVPRKRRELPVASTHFDTVNEAPVVERAELLALASKIFDPQRMERDEAEGLIGLLQDAGVLPKKDGRFLRWQMRAGIEQGAVVDLIAFARAMMPASPRKDDVLELLNDIAGRRYQAAS